MYRSLELVTYLGKRVKIETPHSIYTGIFKGARIILKTCAGRVYLCRVSGDNQEWEIEVDLNELVEGIVTVCLLEGGNNQGWFWHSNLCITSLSALP
jgi:hypothetical protein